MLTSQTTCYSQQKRNYYLNINNNNVKKVDLTNFLAAYIDDKLTWKDHISNICKKTAMCIAILNKAKYILIQSPCMLYIVH